MMEKQAVKNNAELAEKAVQQAKDVAEQTQIRADEASSLAAPQTKKRPSRSKAAAGSSQEPSKKKRCFPKKYDDTDKPMKQLTLHALKQSDSVKLPPGTRAISLLEIANRRSALKGEPRKQTGGYEEAHRGVSAKWANDFPWLLICEIKIKNDADHNVEINTTAMFCKCGEAGEEGCAGWCP